MTSIAWKLNRLRSMSTPELAWRLRQRGRVILERLGIGLAHDPPPPDPPIAAKDWLPTPPPIEDLTATILAADELLAGRWTLFGSSRLPLGFPPRWNRDPASGTNAPLIHGKSIDYRDGKLVGNIKTLWEPSRHLELVTLAQAYAVSAESRYYEGCRALLLSWIDQCPYPRGVHWSSSLESAIRLVNWSVAWQLLGGFDSPVFRGAEGRRWRDLWLASVYQHSHFISGHLSLHSSANNHLLGEWMGLFIAALTWPCWQQSRDWLERARAGFESQALTQNAPDGVNREQAVYYHHEVADMMLLCGLASRANHIAFSPEYWRRLEAMMDFILALSDSAGNVPMIGDADDALMLRLHTESDWSPFRALLAAGSVLFDRGDFKCAARNFDGKSRWLLGSAGLAKWDALPATKNAPLRRLFEHGGYAVLGSRFGTGMELRLVADAGPLGYLSIAAHGHADALSFTLSARGVELLIDPGTYAYHTEREWRDWFRGTSAHNTVSVDGQDQSVIGGSFMWMRHARATLDKVVFGPTGDVWQASHDGYQRLSDPVLHRRCIEVEHTSDVVRVTDTLECRGSHTAVFNWHISEAAEVELVEDHVAVRCRNVCLQIAMPDSNTRPALLQGSCDPRGGWVSRRFGGKQPTTQVVWSHTFTGTTQWKTEFRVGTS